MSVRAWPGALLLCVTVACADSPDYCEVLDDWDPVAAAFEAEVLELVNARRAAGANCGGQGSFEPAAPLVLEDRLTCAARAHSRDMQRREFFSHDNPDGDGPQERIERAGYEWSTWGENIAGGYPTPEQVMQGWMSSDGHCANIMRPSFTELGVGFYGDRQWTQVFGAPR